MDEAKILAARLLGQLDGKDKQLVLEVLCWTVAASIRHSYEEADQQTGIKTFSNRIPTLIEALAAGERRKPQ